MEFVISPIKAKDKFLWPRGRIHILYIIENYYKQTKVRKGSGYTSLSGGHS